jgi:exonuclease III
MTDIYKLPTLNTNGLASQLRIAILQDFLFKQETDIILLQEVTQRRLTTFEATQRILTQERPGEERLS